MIHTAIPLTIIIPTHQEEQNLKELLPQLQWAAEIMVVDSFSTDQTVAIAEQYHAKVFVRKYVGPADQKNWAIDQATYPWILILDADERLTAALEQEIKQLMQQPNEQIDGYWIARQNYFMGKKIRYSGWQGDRIIRLFQQSKCRYNDKQVHEEIEETGSTEQLQYAMDHYTYRNLDHFLDKMRRYARWSAQDYHHKTPKVTYFHLWLKPAFRFFKHFVLKRGFLDGYVGFVVSVLMAWGVFLRYVYIQEMQQSEV